MFHFFRFAVIIRVASVFPKSTSVRGHTKKLIPPASVRFGRWVFSILPPVASVAASHSVRPSVVRINRSPARGDLVMTNDEHH